MLFKQTEPLLLLADPWLALPLLRQALHDGGPPGAGSLETLRHEAARTPSERES